MAFRVESSKTGVTYCNTFKEAFDTSKKEGKYFIQLQFDLHDTKESEPITMRWRCKLKKQLWCVESEKVLCKISEDYANEKNPNKIFWIWQMVTPKEPLFLELIGKLARKEITREEYDDIYFPNCIQDVCSEKVFQQRFESL